MRQGLGYLQIPKVSLHLNVVNIVDGRKGLFQGDLTMLNTRRTDIASILLQYCGH
jgi:hypothetical protein